MYMYIRLLNSQLQLWTVHPGTSTDKNNGSNKEFIDFREFKIEFLMKCATIHRLQTCIMQICYLHINSALNQSFKHALYVHVHLFGSTNEMHARIS